MPKPESQQITEILQIVTAMQNDVKELKKTVKNQAMLLPETAGKEPHFPAFIKARSTKTIPPRKS